MGNFYESLIETMQSGPCVVMTVLEGEEAGKKVLLQEPVEEYHGKRFFCEKVGLSSKLVICGGGHVCPFR